MVKRFKKASFNSKLIIDVMIASLIVQKAPGLINTIFPIDESLQAVVGVGAGYLVGSVAKRPDMANASIALGVVDFVSPMLDGLIGGGSSLPNGTTMLPGAAGAPSVMLPVADTRLQNYVTLNDYTNNPSKRLSYDNYSRSYGY